MATHQTPGRILPVPPSTPTSEAVVGEAAVSEQHAAIARLLVRTAADAGRFTDAADLWMRHLADLEEAAQIAWGKAIGCPVDEHQARTAAREAQAATCDFMTKARVDASKAVGALVAGWDK